MADLLAIRRAATWAIGGIGVGAAIYKSGFRLRWSRELILAVGWGASWLVGHFAAFYIAAFVVGGAIVAFGLAAIVRPESLIAAGVTEFAFVGIFVLTSAFGGLLSGTLGGLTTGLVVRGQVSDDRDRIVRGMTWIWTLAMGAGGLIAGLIGAAGSLDSTSALVGWILGLGVGASLGSTLMVHRLRGRPEHDMADAIKPRLRAVGVLQAWLAAALAGLSLPAGLLLVVGFAAGSWGSGTGVDELGPAIQGIIIIVVTPLIAIGPIGVWMITALLISEFIDRASMSTHYWDRFTIAAALTLAPGIGIYVGMIAFFIGGGLTESLMDRLDWSNRLLIALSGAAAAAIVTSQVARGFQSVVWRRVESGLGRSEVLSLAARSGLLWGLGIAIPLGMGPGRASYTYVFVAPLLLWAGIGQIRALHRIRPRQQPLEPVEQHQRGLGRFWRPLAYVMNAFAKRMKWLGLGEPEVVEGEGTMRMALRRSSRPLMLVGGLVLFALLGFFAGSEYQSGQSPTVKPIEEAQIVLAAQTIPRGVAIRPEMIIVVPYPLEYLVETMVTSADEALNREARIDIDRGVPVTEGMLVPLLTEVPSD